MPRPDRTEERRDELLPVVAEAFARLGYRRATTATLAARCGVRENVLYRLWPDKKAMFLASIRHVYDRAERIWEERAALGPEGSTASRLLEYESRHLGEFGLYRILFTGLSETEDPEIRAHLRDTYRKFQRWIKRRIEAHDRLRGGRPGPEAELIAWAMVGLGTVANVGREIDLFPARVRARLIADAGRLLLEGGAP
ncbi:MAG: TetR/AcrR family transcriptional regulator [Acidobacteriia bacterium]|nr:TetR/AcrR family transcriptional regulator [Terriglobia bacterium]